jgi:hypothetical protein
MKSRCGCGVGATVLAALTIIGCCLGSMNRCEKRRVIQRKQLEDAVQNWEGEGGAVVVRDDDELEVSRA